MFSLSLDELFEKTLIVPYDDDLPWTAVHELRAIGTRAVFDRAVQWCNSPVPLKRARGADILAQIGCMLEEGKNAFSDESLSVVTELLKGETHAQPIASAIFALGHIGNPVALPLIIGSARHQSRIVRLAVASALGSFPEEITSVQHLMLLCRDVDNDVRDWATFGVGTLVDADTPEIRDILFERIDDEFEDARMEAFIGLAKRKDARIIPKLLGVLDNDEVKEGYIEAAAHLLGLEYVYDGMTTPSEYSRGIRELYNRRD